MAKTLTENNLSLAAYHYKRAVVAYADGDTSKAEKHCATARQYDAFAKETF